MKVSEKEIYNRIRAIIADIAMVSEDQVTPNALLGDEIGMDSMDYVDLQFRLETEYGIEFYHGSVVEKLSELLAPHALEEQDQLTDYGADLLRRRMPEVDPKQLCAGLPTVGIEMLFTPRTWVRATLEILDARPRTCPQCQSDRLKVVKPSILACEGCGYEVSSPDGRHCLKTWVAEMPGPVEKAGQPSWAEQESEGSSIP